MEVRLIAVVFFLILLFPCECPEASVQGKECFWFGQGCNQLKDNEYLRPHIQIRWHPSLCSLLFPLPTHAARCQFTRSQSLHWNTLFMPSWVCQERSRGCQSVCCYCQPALTSKQSVRVNFHTQNQIELQLYKKQPVDPVPAALQQASLSERVTNSRFGPPVCSSGGKYSLWSRLTGKPKIKGRGILFFGWISP